MGVDVGLGLFTFCNKTLNSYITPSIVLACKLMKSKVPEYLGTSIVNEIGKRVKVGININCESVFKPPEVTVWMM